MNEQEIIIAILSLLGISGTTLVGFGINFITKLIKAGNENKIQREAERRVATNTITTKDQQIEGLSSDIAKMNNVLYGVLEILNLQAQTIQTNPELLAKYERIYQDVKSIGAFSFENGKKVLERTREKTQEIVQDVKTFVKEVEAKTKTGALAEILSKGA